MRFRKKVKLSPRYIGPYEILERIREVAYRLVLPPSLAVVHQVIHVSMLRKYHGDLSHVLDFSSVQLDKELSYVEESAAILDRKDPKLRSKNNALAKVQWRGQLVEKVNWETEHTHSMIFLRQIHSLVQSYSALSYLFTKLVEETNKRGDKFRLSSRSTSQNWW